MSERIPLCNERGDVREGFEATHWLCRLLAENPRELAALMGCGTLDPRRVREWVQDEARKNGWTQGQMAAGIKALLLGV